MDDACSGYNPRPDMAGEFDFIQWIRDQQGSAAKDFVQVPPGDDLAVLK